MTGGRTHLIKRYHQTEVNEDIDYYDFTSVFPYFNKNKTYPIGHPENIFDSEGEISQYFGFTKGIVPPPYALCHPGLPLRHLDNLTFLLCCNIVKTENEKPLLEKSYVCPHSPEQCQITGTWCMRQL